MAVTDPVTGRAVDEHVLGIVARPVNELSGGSTRRPALLDSLDRDLGISSLERVDCCSGSNRPSVFAFPTRSWPKLGRAIAAS